MPSSSSSPPFRLYFEIVFQKALPTQDVTNPVTHPECSWMENVPFFLSWLCVRLLHFLHNRSKWSYPFFNSITYKNFQGISDIFFQVVTFQQQDMVLNYVKDIFISSETHLEHDWESSRKTWQFFSPFTSCRYPCIVQTLYTHLSHVIIQQLVYQLIFL